MGFGAQLFGVEVCELDASVINPSEEATVLAADAEALQASIERPMEPIAAGDDDSARAFRERLAGCDA